MTRLRTTLKALFISFALTSFVGACGGKEEPKPAETPKADAAKKDEAKKDEAKKDEAKKDDAKADAPKVDPAQSAALKAMTKTVVNAFKAKDLAKLAEFAPPEMADAVKSMKPGTPEFDRLFDETNWRFKAANSWDGKIHGVKLKGEQAWVHFANVSADELAVAAFKKAGDRWLFHDFKSPAKQRWADWDKAE